MATEQKLSWPAGQGIRVSISCVPYRRRRSVAEYLRNPPYYAKCGPPAIDRLSPARLSLVRWLQGSRSKVNLRSSACFQINGSHVHVTA